MALRGAAINVVDQIYVATMLDDGPADQPYRQIDPANDGDRFDQQHRIDFSAFSQEYA